MTPVLHGFPGRSVMLKRLARQAKASITSRRDTTPEHKVGLAAQMSRCLTKTH